jgi:hypothetical protein
MIVDSRSGLTLFVTHLHEWWWRGWEWQVVAGWSGREPYKVMAEGRAWTHRGATLHGNICRTLMLAAGSPVATRYPQDDLEGWR